jgi:hypothetical protein
MRDVYPVMNQDEWEVGKPPVGAFPVPWGPTRLSLGNFAAAPLGFQNGTPVATISTPQLAFEVLGPYWDPTHPERGRFPRLPSQVALINPIAGVAFAMRRQGFGNI